MSVILSRMEGGGLDTFFIPFQIFKKYIKTEFVLVS